MGPGSTSLPITAADSLLMEPSTPTTAAPEAELEPRNDPISDMLTDTPPPPAPPAAAAAADEAAVAVAIPPPAEGGEERRLESALLRGGRLLLLPLLPTACCCCPASMDARRAAAVVGGGAGTTAATPATAATVATVPKRDRPDSRRPNPLPPPLPPPLLLILPCGPVPVVDEPAACAMGGFDPPPSPRSRLLPAPPALSPAAVAAAASPPAPGAPEKGGAAAPEAVRPRSIPLGTRGDTPCGWVGGTVVEATAAVVPPAPALGPVVEEEAEVFVADPAGAATAAAAYAPAMPLGATTALSLRPNEVNSRDAMPPETPEVGLVRLSEPPPPSPHSVPPPPPPPSSPPG